jgi:hypothetical protein
MAELRKLLHAASPPANAQTDLDDLRRRITLRRRSRRAVIVAVVVVALPLLGVAFDYLAPVLDPSEEPRRIEFLDGPAERSERAGRSGHSERGDRRAIAASEVPVEKPSTSSAASRATQIPTESQPEQSAPLPTDALTCIPPTPAVMDWLRSMDWFRSKGDSSLPMSDVTMVEVGPGNDPDETWWIVAAVSYSDAWGVRGEYEPVTFLTTTPSEENPRRGKWINVGRAAGAPKGTYDWSNVSWTGERLARGKTAQAKALTCVPD